MGRARCASRTISALRRLDTGLFALAPAAMAWSPRLALASTPPPGERPVRGVAPQAGCSISGPLTNVKTSRCRTFVRRPVCLPTFGAGLRHASQDTSRRKHATDATTGSAARGHRRSHPHPAAQGLRTERHRARRARASIRIARSMRRRLQSRGSVRGMLRNPRCLRTRSGRH